MGKCSESEDTSDTESCTSVEAPSASDDCEVSGFHEASSQGKNLSDEHIDCVVSKTRKEVSFCGSVKVMLIPSVVDYKEARLCDTLWWTAEDMKRFHMETVISLHDYMRATHVKDTKLALRMLLEAEVLGASSSLRI